MNQRHSMGLVAGAATMLAALPLSAIFVSITWMVYVGFAIAMSVGVATLVRMARGAVWAQFAAMVGGLAFYLTVVFPSGDEFARFVPTLATLRHFGSLLVEASTEIREESIPVPDLPGLLLLTTLGVAGVAILVDVFAVGLRRPALAGLPMLAIYSVPVAVLPGGLSFVPFACAATGFLWLLVFDSVDRVRRFGRRFTGEGRDLDMWEPSPLASAGRRLGLVGLVTAILVPLAVPGLTTGLLGNLTNGDGLGFGSGPGRGTSAAVDLFARLSGELTRDQAVEMIRVSTNDPAPYYVRIGIADDVSDSGFSSKPPATGVNVSRDLPAFITPAGPEVSSHRYQARFSMINFDMNLAPAYQQVVGVRGLDNTWFFDASTNQIFTRRSRTAGKTYDVDFVRVAYSANALRTAGEIPAGDPVNQLAVVPQVQQVNDLVEQLTEGKTTEYDRVRAIYDFFSPSNGFTYRVRAEHDTSSTAIVTFLTKRAGFCVQYAAAMGWLVRAAGYPARVAFGFTRGSGGAGGTYSLTNFNLHAWTEVYFPQFGWVPFDSTPAGAIVGSVSPAWAPDPNNPSGGTDESPDIANRQSASPSASLLPGSDTGQGSDVTGGPGMISGWLVGLAATGVLLVALLLAPSLRRRALRRSRRAHAEQTIVIDTGGPRLVRDVVADPQAVMAARRDAHAAWSELLDTMVDYSVPVDEAETPRATAERFTTLPDLASGTGGHVSLLARAEERARYARIPLRPDGLNDAVRAVRTALRQRATGRQRIAATLLPRSVLLSWRAAWLAWTSRVVNAMGSARERVAAANPRRLIAGRAR